MPLSSISRFTAPFARLTLFLVTALALCAVLGVCARPAQATVYYAATNGLATNSGLSWSSPKTLASALSTASGASSDQVWVKKGTYTGNFTATDGVAVYGGFNGTETSIGQRNITANLTILDGNNSGAVYTIPILATKTNTFDGFTVENGTQLNNTNGNIYGGGLYAPTPDSPKDTLNIANCNFIANTADYGGAIYAGSLTTTISNCTFSNNNANGGGIYCGGATTNISDCMFKNNAGGYTGGGVEVASNTTTITGCTFSNNNNGVYAGGPTAIKDCSFSSNNALFGAGVWIANTVSTITDCTFSNNSAVDGGYGGGGVLVAAGPGTTITGCTFTNNTAASFGGGIDAYSGASTITDCTFISNSAEDGGGVYANPGTGVSVTIDGHSTFTSNSATHGNGGDIYAIGCTPIIEDCVFNGSYTNGTNNAIYLSYVGYTSTSPDTPAAVKDCLIVGAGTSTSDPDGIDVETYDSNYPTSDITFANNTIVKTNVGINFASNSGAISVANNIFDHNDGGLNVASGPAVTLSHNDFFNNVGYNAQGANLTATDLMVDPLFVNSGGGDYHLLLGSPVIDAGDDNYVVHGDTDLDGHPRIMGAHVDIGAYEGTESATLTSVSPAAVQAGSAAFTLTLMGHYFLNTSVVDWNGTALTTTYVSATEITASVPASLVATAGSAVVTVANPGAYASNSKTIAINPVATLTSLSPMSIPAGSPAFTLTVNGTKFVTGAVVSFKGAALATTVVSATQLTAIIPTADLSATGMVSVTAANPGTAASNALMFNVTAALVPTITSFSPASGLVGSVVTITGTNLAGVTAVRFHNANATTFSPNAAGTQINILVPSGAATGTITVTTPGGSVKTATNFTVLVPPTITSFTPTSGPVGTVITITGTNLNGATRVRFHNANAVTYSANADGTQLTVTVPTGAGTGTITVNTPGGQVTSAGTFTVTTAPAPPTVTSFTPTSGPIGTVVTVTGTNLNGVTAVRFHNANASVFSANGAGTQLTVTVPTGAGTGTFTITTPGGSVKTMGTFTVN